MDREEQRELSDRALAVFQPRQAVRESDHLAGRFLQINQVRSGIRQPGAHVVLFGERGVGKTSLANCVAEITSRADNYVIPPINCDRTDTFASLWHKIFQRIAVEGPSPMGLVSRTEEGQSDTTLDDALPEELNPYTVERALESFATSNDLAEVLVMIDEVEIVEDENLRGLLTDLLKSISDHHVPATIVIIGIALSVTELIRAHESVSRHIIEVPVPRMSREEQKEILDDRIPQLGMSIGDEVVDSIVWMSRGFPFYVQLLGQKAVLSAIEHKSRTITEEHLGESLSVSLSETEQSLKAAYYAATRSSQPTSRFAETLAACALAKTDEQGHFTPTDLVEPYQEITGEKSATSPLTKRLDKFCTPDREEVLVAAGTKKYDARYRFRNPMMVPYVIMKSVADGLISHPTGHS